MIKNRSSLVIIYFFSAILYSQTTIYTADFEIDYDGWNQSVTDDFDWTRDSGGTPTSSTGPSTAASGSYYMYTESSNPNYPNKIAYFESPSFDLSGITNPTFTFYYHMYGSNMGTLYVDISTDDGTTYPTNLWLQSGQVQTSNAAAWTPINLDLSAYIGQTVKLRFRGLTDSSYRSDMAIDNISLTVTNSAPEINIIGNGLTITNGDLIPSFMDYTDFGTTDLATTRTRTFSIQNTGSLTLNLTGSIPLVAISGDSEFTISSQPTASSILSGGSNLTFDVLFTPTVAGTNTAVISIDNNDSDENPYTFTVSANAQQSFFDSDRDGIYDNIDIDDDNDGIKDDFEEISCRNSSVGTTATYKFLNETFGTGVRTTINTTYDATTTYCYEDGIDGSVCSSDVGYSMNDGEYTVGNSAQIATWAAAQWWLGGDHTGDTDGRMALFNADYVPGVFYTATINGALPNIPITYSFWVLNLIRTDGTAGQLKPDIRVEFRDINDNILTNITTGLPAIITTGDIPESITGASNSWHQFTADLILNTDEFYVYFINNQVGGMGNDLALDDILISQTLCDADSDGVADLFDLDSDNDGIPDIVEFGNGQFSDGTAKISAGSWVDANLNGMNDASESNIALDSDGDGVPNYLDLDSDNDGIFDVDEARSGNINAIAGFENGDGDISGNGVGEGSDSDTFRETDTNSDGILEYFSDGILDIYDYFNGGTFNTSYGNINQGSTGIGWSNYVKDTDNDGIPDYIDITSNGVTYDIAATLYASLDANNDGIIDGDTDTDGDGILDAFDTDNTIFGSPRDLDRKLDLYFDGRNDYAEDISIINLSEATLMGWIKIDATATGDQVLLGQNEFYLQLKTDKKIEAIANGNTVSTLTALNTNQWIHVAATYSSSNSKLKLFINGEIIDSTNIFGNLPVDTSHFTIGRKPDTNSNYFKGYFDEVRIFDKALSENLLHKMVYQEIENNSGIIKGSIIPRNVTDYVNSTTINPLVWTSLKRCFRMDVYKDDIIDDLSTTSIDTSTGARIYNVKLINSQSAPLPFITQIGDTTLDNAVNIPSKGVLGIDATTYDWSIVKIEHKNITSNTNQKHLGLIINNLDASLNPIEFSIQNDTELNVSWYLELDGAIDLEGESQLVQGDDSILDEDSGGYIEKDQQGTANSFNYNYWTSSVGPISGNTSTKGTGIASINANSSILGSLLDGSIADNGIYPRAINFNAAYTAADSGPSTPITISSYWLYTFNGTSDDYNSWNAIDGNTPLKPGEGYTMKGTSGSVAITTNQNYVFKGKPNNGDITLSILAGNNRLIGNPYASAIDADEFIKDNIKETINSKTGRNTVNVFNGALYFWHHFGEENSHILKEYVGGYATYTLMGGVEAKSIDSRINNNLSTGGKAPERYIPVNQGFFVNAYLPSSLSGITSTVDGGTIIFKNSQRVFQKEISNSGNGSVFFKTNSKNKKNIPEKEIDTRSKIRLVFDSSNGYHRQLLIGVDENTSNHFDMGYDAPIADIANEDLFWVVDDSKFVIQGVPNFNEDQQFPLGLKIKEQALIKIKIDKLENIDENTAIYIKDNLTDETYNLSEKAFEINLEPGEYLNRFELTFQPRLKTLKETTLASGIFINMNNHTSELQINRIIDTEIINIKLFNYLGQEIENWNGNFNERKFTIPIKKSAGVYIIHITTKIGAISKKIIIG